MNLKKLVRYIILLWLPIAKSEYHNETKVDQRIQNENDSKSLFMSYKSNKSEEKNEENPTEIRLNKWKFKKFSIGTSKASENFLGKISANSKLNKESQAYETRRNAKSAHKLNGRINKGLSALYVDNVRNKSAATPKTFARTRRKRKSLEKNLSSDIVKRKAVMEISFAEKLDDDPNSLEDYEEDEFDDIEESNSTEMGSYLGAPCELTCSEKLLHVFCDPTNRVCECEEKYPVQIGVGRGCEKPKQLGDQCFYAQTCSFFDPNAECTQINHNAICQCKPGYHTVALRKGARRIFCSEDIIVVSADLPTLLGVAAGIAVLTGLICFVLRLFSGNRYPPTRHYANANLAPPLLLSSDNQWINGIPLTVHGRPSSRASSQRSTMNLAQYSRNKGVLVSASRAGAAREAAILLIPCHLQSSRHSDALKNSNNDSSDAQHTEVEKTSRFGSRRPSLSSVHSTTSSQKSMSYSARRFEQENQQREQRAAMRSAREEAARLATPPTPSPMSTDELIPACSKIEEESPFCTNMSQDPTNSVTMTNALD